MKDDAFVDVPDQHLTEKFIDSINWAQDKAYSINVINGWWEKRLRMHAILKEHGIDNSPNQIIELCGLIDSEIAEAMEAARKHKSETWADPNTKDTLVRELAGAVVRIMDLCEHYKLPLGEAFIAELNHNSGRGYMHGGKAA